MSKEAGIALMVPLNCERPLIKMALWEVDFVAERRPVMQAN